MNQPLHPSPSPDWPGSFERDTLVFELGHLVARLVRSVTLPLTDPEELPPSGRPLFELAVSEDARIALHRVEARRIVVHLLHPAFEVVVQAVLAEHDGRIEALRTASVRGDAMTALVWCQGLTRHPPPALSPDGLDHSRPYELD